MEHWNAALRLIEEDLTEAVDVAALARVAQTSEHHFRRMQQLWAGAYGE